MTLSIDQRLQNRYRIRDRLGQGGMGTVYLAEDLNLPGRTVAIKENADTAPVTQQQFQREAVILSSLNHPNLPRVTDHFIEPSGHQYLVMDYVQGEDLRELLQQQSVLPEPVVLAWVHQVMDALEYMHSWIDPETRRPNPVIHRDIKPGNIKRAPDGRVVLVDFGLAKYEELTVTIMGARAVTPGYSPLEQYTGGTSIRSDIYALGATLYALLTGQRPPEAPMIASGTRLPTPRRLNPKITRATEKVILHALQIQATERYATVREMRIALFGKRGTNQIQEEQRAALRRLGQPSSQKTLTPAAQRWTVLRISITLILLSVVAWTAITFRDFLEIEDLVAWWEFGKATLFRIVLIFSKYWLWFVAFLVCVFIISKIALFVKILNLWSRWIWSRIIAIQHATVTLVKALQSDIYIASSTPSPKEKVEPGNNLHDIPSNNDLIYNEEPSIHLKEEQSQWTKHTNDQIIDDLIVQKELDSLTNFITNSEGGRYILTGYGRFGGTSLIKGAINKAKHELQNSKSNKRVLLVFYFIVEKDQVDQNKFVIKANEFNFVILATHNDTINNSTLLQKLSKYAKLTDVSSKSSEFVFLPNTILDDSFFQTSSSSSGKKAEASLDFDQLVNLLNSYFDNYKSNDELREIILKLIDSNTLPSRIVIILDRIDKLETLENLNQMDLFRNKHISIIGVAKNETVDQWLNCNEILSKLSFRKWYIRYSWETPLELMQRANNSILRPKGFTEMEDEKVALPFWKYLYFRHKGAMGDIWEELKQAPYWSRDRSGNQILAIAEWVQKSSVQHKAWMFDLLDKNWLAIFDNLFTGNDEKRDRARIGVYHLADWIIEMQVFSKEELRSASYNTKVTISENTVLINIVTDNLISVLQHHNYLKGDDNHLQINWQESSPPPIVGNRKYTSTYTTIAQQLGKESQNYSDPTLSSSTDDFIDDGKNFKPKVADIPATSAVEDNSDKGNSIFYQRTDEYNSIKQNDNVKILFLAANSTADSRIRFDDEHREIQQVIRNSKFQKQINLQIRMAVRTFDLTQALIDIQPQIVHFAGHGTIDGSLYIVNEKGEAHPIKPSALATLFKQFKKQIKCVILNTCYSENQAKVIAEHIEYVIGIKQEIEDNLAISFAVGFYQAIGAGKTIEESFEMGKTHTLLNGALQHLEAILITKGEMRT